MEEITKALGPWPVLQFAFVVITALGGAWVVFKGISNSKKSDVGHQDDQREKWEAYNQLENIEQNSFKMLEQNRTLIDEMRQMTAAMRQVAAALWNRSQ